MKKDKKPMLHEIGIQAVTSGFIIRIRETIEFNEGRSLGVSYHESSVRVAEDVRSLINNIEKIVGEYQ